MLARTRHAATAHSVPTASSTSGYRQLIDAPQLRQRPRSASQLTSGTFSHHASVRPQLRQCERGLDDALALGPAAQAHVQEAAEGQPEKPGEDGSEMRIIEEIEYTALMSCASSTWRSSPTLPKRLKWSWMDLPPEKSSAKDPTPPATTDPARAAALFEQSVAIMARLRAPGGCPWDREQSFDSIRKYTLEEAYEVFDAIERRDFAHLSEELGDLLLQVLFYAEMAANEGHFTHRGCARSS